MMCSIKKGALKSPCCSPPSRPLKRLLHRANSTSLDQVGMSLHLSPILRLKLTHRLCVDLLGLSDAFSTFIYSSYWEIGQVIYDLNSIEQCE
ncbi:hypothetical protein Syun_021477 [Stephania yunnanensis]|uniref:Uncharacterized protein n=1 Tax=Stephania yunnanensis TaxID=152371 RepID=A0AAP0IG52_9MAGN